VLQWYLEGFDCDTDQLVQRHHLPNLSASEIRRILRLYSSVQIEPFDFNVPTLKEARELAMYAVGEVELVDDLDYQLDCFQIN